MTISVSLPIVDGGIGAGVDVSGIAAKKTLVVRDVTGKVSIECSDDDVNYCPVPGASFSSTKSDIEVELVASYMRLNATAGTAGSADVSGEAAPNRFVTLPAPVAPDQAGAAVDVSLLGNINTAKIADVGNGTAELEISQDGVHYAQGLPSFSDPGCRSGKFNAISARVRGRGGQPGAMQLGAQDSPFSGISEPREWLVYDYLGEYPAAPNVYTDWDNLVAARQAIVGPAGIWFPAVPGGTPFPDSIIPGGAGSPYPMDDTIWHMDGRANAVFQNDAQVLNLLKIEGRYGQQFPFVTTANLNDPAIIFDFSANFDYGEFAIEKVLLGQYLGGTTPLVEVPANAVFRWTMIDAGPAKWLGFLGPQFPTFHLLANVDSELDASGSFIPSDTFSSADATASLAVRWSYPSLHRLPFFRVIPDAYGFRLDDQPNYTGAFPDLALEFGGMRYSNLDGVADDGNDALNPYAGLHNDNIGADTTAGPVWIDAPMAANHYGFHFDVKDIGDNGGGAFSGNATANNITIQSSFGDTFDGAATLVINADQGQVRLVSDGVSNWRVM